MKTCLNNQCAKSLENNFLICPYCGIPQRRQTARRVRSVGTISTPVNGGLGPLVQCSRCGGAQVQKVSAIYRSGSWQSNGVTMQTGYGGQHDNLGFSTAYGRTMLASALAPPAAPYNDGIDKMIATPTALALLCYGVHNISCGIYNMCVDFVSGGYALYLVLGLISGFVGYKWLRYIWKPEKDLAQQMERYEHELSLWHKKWYCHHCDFVFLPPVAAQPVFQAEDDPVQRTIQGSSSYRVKP